MIVYCKCYCNSTYVNGVFVAFPTLSPSLEVFDQWKLWSSRNRHSAQGAVENTRDVTVTGIIRNRPERLSSSVVSRLLVKTASLHKKTTGMRPTFSWLPQVWSLITWILWSFVSVKTSWNFWWRPSWSSRFAAMPPTVDPKFLNWSQLGAYWIWLSDVSRTPGQTGLQFVGFLQCPVCTCVYIYTQRHIYTHIMLYRC